MGGVMRRHGLRFGLLGPPVLYTPDDTPDDTSDDTSGDTSDGVSDGGGLPYDTVRSPKVRVLLAALLLDAGRIVPVESLKEALWGGAPPASAQASLHNHVTRLRRLLDAPERLRAVPPGYQLRVEQGELDVHVFECHVAAARGAHAARNWERVVRECAAALALWRGAPLSGLPADLGGYAFVRRLREARLLLLEWRYDAELALGGLDGFDVTRFERIVPELTALAAEYPLREAYQRQLMLALHRTGRQAEALAVHRDLRARLVEELGIEPGPAVREAHAEVLGPTATDDLQPQGRSTDHLQPLGRSTDDLQPQGRSTDDLQPQGRPTDDLQPQGRSTDDLQPQGRSTDDLQLQGRPTDDLQPQGQPSPPPPSPIPVSPTIPVPSSIPVPASAPALSARRTHHPAQLPAQLPPPPAHFTGRGETLLQLLRTLATDRPNPSSPSDPSNLSSPSTPPADLTDLADLAEGNCPVVVLSGMAGVGKSALALYVAHALKERFFDGQLYLHLHGATPGMTPLPAGQALVALLRDLGTEPRNIPEHPDAAAALLRTLLAPTRTLLVLDDAATAAQVRPLLPAGPGCAVIVTSRSPLTALDGAHRFPLAPLSGEDSAALLRAASGPGEGRADLDAAHPLVDLTGRLPLALRVVAARLAARSALTPDALAGQLAATEGRLSHLEYDDLSVRRSLAVAHDALAASGRQADRDAALVLRRIGALDLPSYGVPLLARLTGTDEPRAEAALNRLVDVALLEERAYGRYTPHDLVRDFARELAELPELPELAESDGTADSLRTALHHYAAVAERALTAILGAGPDEDDRRRPTAAQPPAHAAHVTDVPPFPGPEEAFAWGDTELENIVALVEGGSTTGDEEAATAALVSTLLRLLFPYLQRRGRVAEMEVLGRTALRAARRLGDAAAEAYALGDLAGLHFLTGRQQDALALNDRALAIWRRLDRLSWIRRCLNNRGLLLEGLGRYEESCAALRQSLEYSRQLADRHGEAVTHSHLGNLYEHTDPRAAIEQHRRSLAIGDEIGAVIVQHSAHCNIGYAHLALGEPAAALPHFEESLRIPGGHDDWHGESQTRLGLVRALRALGPDGSARALRECVELLRRADARADRYTGGLARHQHGLVLREQGEREHAREEWRAALDALDGTDEKAVVQELRELIGEPSGESIREPHIDL
ncbi:BTAD domain-containing putative transcriptional regulator [Streptomyces sp. NPDC000618]|uniref:AfsR/SARP family transcriptional regulator n=1 Tax=Streptomyces sp. NPDC000618 TaxID=3154265 RepID=UPI0033253CD2